MLLMLEFARFILRFEGKKALFVSFFLGVLATLALPPVYLLPLAVIAFSAHLWMLEACATKREAFLLGWWFGFGHFVSGLYWISFALLTDVENFGWLIPFAIFGIAGVVAFYPAFIALCTFVLPVKGYRRVIAFACVWTLFEILRGYLFTGFPWNLMGYVWTVSDPMMQLASITGVWGLSFVTILTFAMPAACVVTAGRNRVETGSFKPVLVAAALLFSVWLGGALRLSNAPDTPVEGVGLRIVQANIEQTQKWDAGHRRAIVERYLAMTRSRGFEDISHVIWPETALPFYLEEGSPLLEMVKLAVPPKGAIITGSLRAESPGSGFSERIWNSVHVIDEEGHIAAFYDKHHLVPFGEYVPFRTVLPMEKITHGMVDFSAGSGPQTITAPFLPAFSPLVCYEAIFPGQVVNSDILPRLMINVTNDAWYGNTSGPYQHFSMTRMRAVEQGIPLIRAANTGISGVIDAYGRVVAHTKLGETTTLDSYLPQDLKQGTTFSKIGLKTILLIVVFCGFFLLFWR